MYKNYCSGYNMICTIFHKHTCLKKVIGFWPIAWQSPMLALMTSVNGFFIPYIDGAVNEKVEKVGKQRELKRQRNRKKDRRFITGILK